MLDELHFRHVMGHLPTGVSVITSRGEGGAPCGFTANAVTSVSLNPFLILVCVHRGASSLPCIVASGVFSISVLAAEDEALARRFAGAERDVRFEGVALREETTGSPVLEGAVAWADCTVRAIHDAGDHVIVVGEVVACDARDGDALLFFRGGYQGVSS